MAPTPPVVNWDVGAIGERVGERMADEVDRMARQAFVGITPRDPHVTEEYERRLEDTYEIGEMWGHKAEKKRNDFQRLLTGKQHEAKDQSEIWSDFPDADIADYDFFR